jgi:transcriptional coactivator HFI1/ADA1
MAASSKTAVTSDAAEQRLKAEVMALSARDRRRLKAVANDKVEEEAAARRNPYEEYYMAARIKAPETAAAAGAAGGLTKTNWDLEIRKKYLQPLFSETLEFPDSTTIHARIVPICYEEAVAAGCSMQCADLVGLAAEIYLKGILSETFDRTRSNGPRYENSAAGGILTSSYKKKIAREEAEVKLGKLARTRDDDLLPCEAEAAYSRRPLGMADLQLTTNVGPSPWNAMPLIGVTVSQATTAYDYDEWYSSQQEHAAAASNGDAGGKLEDSMDVDDKDNNENYGWEGAGAQDRSGLESVLADCLAISV